MLFKIYCCGRFFRTIWCFQRLWILLCSVCVVKTEKTLTCITSVQSTDVTIKYLFCQYDFRSHKKKHLTLFLQNRIFLPVCMGSFWIIFCRFGKFCWNVYKTTVLLYCKLSIYDILKNHVFLKTTPVNLIVYRNCVHLRSELEFLLKIGIQTIWYDVLWVENKAEKEPIFSSRLREEEKSYKFYNGIFYYTYYFQLSGYFSSFLSNWSFYEKLANVI